MAENNEGQIDGAAPGEDAGSSIEDSNEFKTAFDEAQKQIQELKKEMSGLDKKNAQLLKEKEEREKAEQRKARQKDMSPKELEAFLARESAQEVAEARRQAEEARAQLAKLQAEVERKRVVNRVISEKGNIPNILRRVLTEERPEDPDELSDWIDDFIRSYETEQVMSTNRIKTGVRPQVGNKVSSAIPTNREWETMTEAERDAVARSLPDEKLKEIMRKDLER